MLNRSSFAMLLFPLLSAACSKDPVATTQTATHSEPVVTAQASADGTESEPQRAQSFGPAQGAEPASVGKPAPDFTLPDLDGEAVKLSQFKGKTVVLEWFNPECPFVKKSHTVGSLVGLAKKHADQGVVWLAINSGAPGKQGHGEEVNRQSLASFKLEHPLLLDEAGTVGKLYGAKHTPHMFVIDAQGTLVYRGAIDNSPDAEGASPEGGKLVNYVEQALARVSLGKKPETAETDAYGCGVKYAD